MFAILSSAYLTNLSTAPMQRVSLSDGIMRPRQPSRRSLAILFPEGRKYLIADIKKEVDRYLGSCKNLQQIRQEFTTGNEYDDLQRYFIDLFVEELMTHVLELTREMQWIKELNTRPEATQRGLSPLDIQKAKERDIADLMPNEVRHVGDKLVAKCPFHSDDSPSFNIFSDNHYHCFGCQAHGDSIEFVMKLQGLTFPEAVKYLITS